MYVAIGIGALLLGGWVLESPPVPEEPQQAKPAAKAAPMLPSPGMTGPSRAAPARPPREPSQQQQQPSMRSKVMPRAPTAPSEPGAPGLAPPTQMEDGQAPLPGLEADGAYGFGPRMPMAPTYRRPTPREKQPSAYSDAFAQQQKQLTAAVTPQKAFNNYQSPPSGVSPYMNLFRNDTANGTIDNYTTLVRPALQQQSSNQQFGHDIFGLQRNVRIQNAALRQMDRNTRNLQGVGTPQYYMNYGGYYPNYGP